MAEEQAGLCSPCPDTWSASSACFLLWTEQHLLVGGRRLVFAAPLTSCPETAKPNFSCLCLPCFIELCNSPCDTCCVIHNDSTVHEIVQGTFVNLCIISTCCTDSQGLSCLLQVVQAWAPFCINQGLGLREAQAGLRATVDVGPMGIFCAPQGDVLLTPHYVQTCKSK